MRSFIVIAVLLAAAAALAGCGAGDEQDDAGTAVSIDQALDSDSDEPLLVSGNLLALGDEVRLCSALAESFPPQCGGASLVVQGLSLEDVENLITEGDVSWSDRPIELRGVVSDGTLTVSEDAPDASPGGGGGGEGESTEPRPGPAVEVTITSWPQGRDGPSHEATLTCEPATGTHPSPEDACAALAADRAALEPVPPDAVCTLIYGGPQEARIVGVIDGVEVDAEFSRANGCEIDRWDRMAAVVNLGD